MLYIYILNRGQRQMSKRLHRVYCRGLKPLKSQHKHKQQLHVIFLICIPSHSTICSVGSAVQHLLLSYLEKVGGQLFVSVPIIEGQSGGETGHGDAMLHASADCSAP